MKLCQKTVTLSAGFASAPAVFSQVQTNNDASFVGTRQRSTSAGSFQVAMEEEESSDTAHGSETIGWVAIQSASGTWSGHSYQSGVTADSVKHSWYTVSFSPAFGSAPRFLAALYTYDGGDSSHLRYQSLGASSAQVKVEEDTTYDTEMNHTSEKVAWLAIEGDGTLEATSIGVGFVAPIHYVQWEGSPFGWLGSIIQTLGRTLGFHRTASAYQQTQDATPSPIATPTLTAIAPTPSPTVAQSTPTSIIMPTPSPTPTLAQAPFELESETSLLAGIESMSFGAPVTITYTYDPLYRLTAANYSTGESFHYTYDAVGNRLTETTHEGSNAYLYDVANRLVEVDGVSFTWDDNGNLLSDGVSSYTYDHANRLIGVEQGDDSYSFAYSGSGDRLSQAVNGVPTDYTLDIVSGLTQVLADGTNAYLYGMGRIGEQQPDGWGYHLGDALGSVRQLVEGSGVPVQARAFAPFGRELSAAGEAATAYGFTGEWGDATGLTFLRARYYASGQGRFLSRDVWEGDVKRPATLHTWNYAQSNPINFIDPSGHCLVEDPDGFCAIPDEHKENNPVDQGDLLSDLLPDWLDICIDCATCNVDIPPQVLWRTIQYLEGEDVRGGTIYSYWLLYSRLYDQDAYVTEGKIRDDVFLALIMVEFDYLRYLARDVYLEAMEALTHQYHAPYKGTVKDYAKGCHGTCDTAIEQVRWMSDIELLRDKPIKALTGNWQSNLGDALIIQHDGIKRGSSILSWTWGNYYEDSPMDKYANNEGRLDWWDVESKGRAWEALYRDERFWVLTLPQDRACTNRPGGSCKGWNPQ